MTASPTSAAMVLPVHRLTPYLRVRIRTDDRSVAVEHRRALVGLIPLWRRRIEVPLGELRSARIASNVRWQCLVAAPLVGASVFLLHVPAFVRVLLGILAVLELPLALGPGKAVRIERRDGRRWTVPFCRTHDFDASLAMEDAERRRVALARSERSPLGGTAPYTPPGVADPGSPVSHPVAGRSAPREDQGTGSRAS